MWWLNSQDVDCIDFASRVIAKVRARAEA